MKHKLVVTALVLGIMAAGSVAVHAYPGYRSETEHGEGHDAAHQERHGTEHQEMTETDYEEYHRNNEHGADEHDRTAGPLRLTEVQLEQIREIREREMDALLELREQTAELDEQMRSLAEEEFFDEEALRRLAEEKAAVEVEITVALAGMRRSIQSVLTEEQLESAKNSGFRGHHASGSHHSESDF